MTRVLGAAFVASLCLTATGVAQDQNHHKGLLVLPSPVMTKPQTFTIIQTTLPTTFSADIGRSGDRLTVNGDADWALKGFPSLVPVLVTKVSRTKDRTDVEMDRVNAGAKVGFDRFKLRFAFAGDTSAAFDRIVIQESDEDAYLARAYRALAPRMLRGTIATLPIERQIELLRFVHLSARGTRITEEIYKGKLYVVVGLGWDSTFYNRVAPNQAGRVAQVLDKRLLAILKAFAPVDGVPVIHGLKLELDIAHPPAFAESDNTAADMDRLELYAPASDIKSFADAHISNQQLIDASEVILNKERIRVHLPSLRAR